jgi:uncharacterized protein with PIN domain
MSMADIRYYLDEHMDAAVAIGLRRRGVDVTTTVDAGLTSASDSEQLNYAIAERRVFVTRDRRIIATGGHGTSHAGIVIARMGRGTIGPTVLALAHLHRTVSCEKMMGRIEYL